MLSFFKLFLSSCATFLILDFIWLNFVAKNFYFERMQNVANIQDGKIQVTLWAGLLVYVLLALGIIHFILPLLRPDSDYLSIFLLGAYFGLVVYGVYDFTNLATLKSWPLLLVAVDVSWGATVTGIATLVTQAVRNFLEK